MNGVLIFLVRAYQCLLSPYMGNCCQFSPHCSAYAILALKQCRWPVALYLITWRLIRCHPWAKGGDDFIPECYKRF